jgi:hypothetical protein
LGTSFWHGQSEGEASIGTSTETNDGGTLVSPNLIEIMVGQRKGRVPWTIIYIVNKYIVIVIFTN